LELKKPIWGGRPPVRDGLVNAAPNPLKVTAVRIRPTGIALDKETKKPPKTGEEEKLTPKIAPPQKNNHFVGLVLRWIRY